MFVIDIKSLDFCFEESDENLFEALNLTVNSGEVVGLVGGNGTGKSTLIKLLVGELKPSNGVIKLSSFGYLPQEVEFDDLNKNLDQLFAEKFLNDEWRGDLAKNIAGLESLGNEIKLKELSGGQKTRLGLGLILAKEREPDLLILDEPTNNLDKEGLEWLKNLIGSYKGGVLIASHERAFLDEVVGGIVAIEDKALVSYGGNYSFYKEQVKLKQESELKAYEKNLGEKRKLEEYVKVNRALTDKVSNESFDKIKHELKAHFNGKKRRSQDGFGRKIKAAHSKIDQLEEVVAPQKDPVLDVGFGAQIPSSKLVLRVAKLKKSFGDKKIFDVFELEVRGAERVLIAGRNGSGKSTLLNLIAGRSEADSGEIVLGENLNLGYFSQDVYGLDLNLTAVEALNLTEKERARGYALLIKAGISKESADKKIGELSRGQQAKIGFVKLMLAQPDVLILDEPTNHLDVETKEAIEKALEGFGGVVILASHDKYFVAKLKPTKVIAL